MAVSRKEQIIRGDDASLPIPTQGLFEDLTGAIAALYVRPKNQPPSNDFVDDKAVITSNLGPFVSHVDVLDFQITSAQSLIALSNYDWYARVKEANGRITTINLKPGTVEVIAPGEGNC